MRVAVAGFTHEALGSSPLIARLEDFRVLRGEALSRAEPYHLDAVARQLEVELVPILSATHIAPSGIVELATYLQLRDEILAGLKAAEPLDGVCLLLHGALLVQHMWSGEADLVREIRALLGPDVRISASFDLHATLTEDFANRADVWTGFRTAPHRDAVETVHRGLSLLAQVIRSGRRPRPVFVRVPLLLQGEKATTDVEPMCSLEAMAREAERDAGILSADVFVGFGWADSPHSSSSISVIAADDARTTSVFDASSLLGAGKPLAVAAASPPGWAGTFSARGSYVGLDDGTMRIVGDGASRVVAGRVDSHCATPTHACGDGGPATDAQLGVAGGLAVGLDGSIYVADSVCTGCGGSTRRRLTAPPAMRASARWPVQARCALTQPSRAAMASQPRAQPWPVVRYLGGSQRVPVDRRRPSWATGRRHGRRHQKCGVHIGKQYGRQRGRRRGWPSVRRN
ncbi:MAG: M81 family metallopeptidase, partial [Chloroflexi bacterium]|nr:M81 family metallopeptidase [Chloroflexota bacterium]